MNYVFNYIKENYLSLLSIVLLLFISIFLIIYLLPKNDQVIKYNDNIIAYDNSNSNTEVKIETVNVDIKGAVKKQGIYKVDKESTISDVIKKAGGLKNNATTLDINLSKTVYNEMVIYISTKGEYANRYSNNNKNDVEKEIASKDSYVSDYNNTTANNTIASKLNDNSEDVKDNKLININSANKEEILKIPGIGESKADKIIAYRNENGLFNTKEEIKNVSGIGDSIYEKIKDYITI